MNRETSSIHQEAFITVCYAKGVVAYNKAAESLFKNLYNIQLGYGKVFSDFLPNPKIQQKLDLCRKAQFQSLVLEYEDNLKLEWYFSPVLDHDGNINKVSIFIKEIPSKKSSLTIEIENELEYNKQIYSNLFYNNPDAVFSFDLEGNFVNANAASAKLAETSIEELLDMHFLPLIPREDHPMVLEKFSNAVNGEPQSYFTNFVSTRNKKRFLEVNNFPIYYNGNIIGVYGIAKDITKQKEAENTVSEERQMLRAIIDNIPDYIFVKDKEHKSILTNKKFSIQMLGQSTNESRKGYSPRDYFEPTRASEIIEDNERVMKSGKPVVNRPDLITNIDGQQERVLLTKVPLKNDADEIIGLVGIARDITQTYLQNKNQELIFKIIKAFGDKPTFEEAMVKTLKIFCKDLGFEYAEAYKVSLNSEKLIRTAFWPLSKDLSNKRNPGNYYLKGEGLPGKVWQSEKVEVLRENDGTGLLENMVLNDKESIKSAVGIPIIFQGKLISLFCLGSISNNKKFEEAMLGNITLQIASAIERKRSQDQLNDFFQYSPNLIAVIGKDGFIQKINPSFIDKFGFSECEILTKPFSEFIHPKDRAKAGRAIKDLSIDTPDLELRCLKKDGNYLWISWRFSRYFSEENVVFIYGADITPLKNVHEDLSRIITERKEVQRKLKDSEQKYKSLFDDSPLPMWVLDRQQLKFLKVNKAAIELYGFKEAEFLKMTVRDLWAPKQADRIEAVVSNNFNNFFQVKVEHKKKDGGRIFVNVNSSPMIFDGQQARISLIKDVTARIYAEEKLLNSEKRFKALVQEGSDLISIVDKDYNYIYNSPASKTVFGLEPAEMNGTNFKDYIAEKDFKAIEPHLEQLQTQKRIQLPSYRVKNARNQWSWIETIITNLSDDTAVGGIVMNSRDITQSMEQERKLLDSLRRYDIVAKATSDLITDYDIQKDEMKVSEVASELFGYTSDTGIYTGEWWSSKIHPDDYGHVKSLAQKMQKEGLKYLTIEYRFRCADGSYKYILDRSYLLLDKNKDPKRIIGSMQDITQRKQHLIDIENHNRKLKEIAWTQSHVVRAPLAKVMGLVDLLLNYKDDLDNSDEILDNILASAKELDTIIRNIAIQTENKS